MISVRSARFALAAALALIVGTSAAPARASVTMYYTTSVNNGLSNYNLGDLTANATFTVSGSTLTVVINNTAAIDAGISDIFFNTGNTAVLGSPVVSTSSPLGLTATISGGTSQDQTADGFGKFNYDLGLGSAPTYLPQGGSITLTMAITSGTLTDADLQGTSQGGGNPGGPFQSAIDWKPLVAGNDGVISTGFGAGSTTPPGPTPAPEPSTLVGASIAGLFGLVMAWRRRKAV